MDDVVALVTGHVRPWVRNAAIFVYEAGQVPAIISACTDCDLTEISDLGVGGVDVYSPAAIADAARAFGSLAGMLSWDDGILVPTAVAAESLGLQRGSVRALQLVRNKFSMRRTVASHGLRGPRFALVGSQAECADAASTVGFPAILKPVNGTGSVLVRNVGSLVELEEQLEDVRRLALDELDGMLRNPITDPDGPDLIPSDTFLVEEYVPGHEIDLEVVIRGGVSEVCLMTEVHFQPGTFIEEAFVSPPTSIDAAQADAVRAAAAATLSILGIDNTTVNMTFRVAGRGDPVLIEVNAGRPGGHMLAPMAWYRSGVNLLAENLSLAVGLPAPDRGETHGESVAAMTLFPPRPGVLLGVRGVETLRGHAAVISVSDPAGIGHPFPSHATLYPLIVLVAGFAGTEQLGALRAELMSQIEFELG